MSSFLLRQHAAFLPVESVRSAEMLDSFASKFNALPIPIMSATERFSQLGYDIKAVFPHQGFFLEAGLQEQVYFAVSDLEKKHPISGIAEFLFDPSVHPVGHVWSKLSKRAVALTTLYKPDGLTLGGDVDTDIYNRELFNGRSAHEIMLRERGSDKATKIIDDYHRLIRTEMHATDDQEDRYGLKSYPYLAGIPDSVAVRTRASAAIDEIVTYAHEDPQRFTESGRALKIASLACGAAGPILELLPRLKESGIDVEKVKLIDWDVMALATAMSMAERQGIGDKVEVLRKDLLRSDLSSYVSDIDVVDLLGLFEYFPDNVGKGPLRYHLAQNFIQELGRCMKPGALIVFGNMLGKRERPYQTVFNQVWPKLEQRSVGDVLMMLERAGFKKDSVSVRIPADGIYAIYTIRIPESGSDNPALTGLQKRIRDRQLRAVAEY